MNTNEHFYAVIMAGGRGERFWPLSTSRRPKQFLKLFGGKPLLAMAAGYVDRLIPPERIFVVTSADLVAATREALPGLPEGNVIGEPVGRDTAAACALGSALVAARDPDASFVVLTADHVIGRHDVFRQTVADGLALALREDVLITIGIPPTAPSTGFGYVEAGEAHAAGTQTGFLKARRFVEKPDEATAREYVASGRYFWNSGMFMWSVKAFQAALAAHQPQLKAMADRLRPVVDTPAFSAALAAEYRALGRISVDYAVMEKATNILMARAAFAWDDVGSWPAIANHFEPDGAGNVVVGDGELLDCGGNIVVSQDRLTALIGVRDLVVVQADGVTLVCPRSRAQDVKKIVQQIGQGGRHAGVL